MSRDQPKGVLTIIQGVIVQVSLGNTTFSLQYIVPSGSK